MTTDFLVEMGTRLAARRKQLGITQENLAEKMNVSIQMISNMEQGKKAIRPDNLVKICSLLEISTDYALTGVKSQNETNALAEKIKKLNTNEIDLIEIIIDYMLNKNI